jgi:hypothetical protein
MLNTPPECSYDCQWRQEFRDFDAQKNALRCETSHLIAQYRCGWRLKKDMLGGRPLDYEPCTFIGV